jgi:large subunit ribosomal protein L21
MYAIIEDGGRQYKVEEGQEVDIDYRDVAGGETLVFDRLLAYRNGDQFQLGQPLLASGKVTAEVVGVIQGPKLVIQKFRRRKNSRRRTGHRQMYTRVKVSKIEI